jgi:hypothetical protein
MNKKKETERDYKLVYRQEIQLSPVKNITEYFEYYQDSNDPTFENHKFDFEFKSVETNDICYYSPGFNILREGKKLSILTRKDFKYFIYEWLAIKNHRSLNWISINRTSEINFALKKENGNYGSLKYV